MNKLIQRSCPRCDSQTLEGYRCYETHHHGDRKLYRCGNGGEVFSETQGTFTVKLFAGFEFPDYEYDYTGVSLQHPNEYAITEGRLVSKRGLDIEIREFLDYVDEEHVAHSNALHGASRPSAITIPASPVPRIF